MSCKSTTAFSPSALHLAKKGKYHIFSDPRYGGKNETFDKNRYSPGVLYIKLHPKMPGNKQLQINPPPNHTERTKDDGSDDGQGHSEGESLAMGENSTPGLC